MNPSSALSWYLSSSYAYYCRFTSMLSDECFDKMCKYLLDNYDKIEHHHKHLVTKEMLAAGTGYNLREKDYPRIVVYSTEELMLDLESKGEDY